MEIGSSVIARYVRSNVLPSVRIRPARTGSSFLTRAGASTYSPAAIDPLQVSGGFNSVIELAAATCRQQVARSIHPAPLDRRITADVVTKLAGSAPPGGVLSALPAATALLTAQDYRGFRLNLVLSGLTFTDEATVTLSFSISLRFVYQAVSLPEVPTATSDQFFDPTRVEQSQVTPDFGSPASAGAVPEVLLVRRSGLQASANRLDSGRVQLSPGGAGAGLSNQGVPSDQDLRSIFIGSFSAELTAPLIHRDEASRCQTRVFADLRKAKWKELLPARPAADQPANEVLLVRDASFPDWLLLATSLLQAPLDLPLSPTLSLVGGRAGSGNHQLRCSCSSGL